MRNPRAIVIDDDVCIRDLLRTFLSRCGFDVIAYETPVMCPVYLQHGETCLQKQKCSDVFITDMTMPGINGIALINRQKKNGCKIDTRNKAIISWNIDKRTEEVVHETGSVTFVKPSRLSELAGWLKECEECIDLETPLKGIERRREMRKPSSGKKKISPVVDPHTVLPGTVINESDPGVCIELRKEVRSGSSVFVRNGAPESPLKATVKLVRSKGNGYIAGLLFE